MKHKYTAKIYFDDGEMILSSGDDIEELMMWMNNQAEASFGEIKGEIIDNMTHQIVKQFEFTPPPE